MKGQFHFILETLKLLVLQKQSLRTYFLQFKANKFETLDTMCNNLKKI